MGSRVSEARAHVLGLIRAGLPPGSPVSVKETTALLRISHTPVREALERLVGEGLLVSRSDRQGFAVPRLSVRDVAGLHHLFGVLLHGLMDVGPVTVDLAGWRPDPAHPAAMLDGLLDGASRAGHPPMVIAALKVADLRLAPYRIVEPAVLPDWAREAEALGRALSAGRPAAGPALTRFTAVRVMRSHEIVAAVEELDPARAPDMYRI